MLNLKSLASADAEILKKLRNLKVTWVVSLLTYFCIAYFVLLTIYLCVTLDLNLTPTFQF